MTNFKPISHLIDPKKKNKKWILDAIKWHFNECKTHNDNGFWWKRKDYDELNLYAIGRQPIDRYKQEFLQSDEPDQSFVTLNHQVVSPAPKLINIALNNVNKITFNTTATAIDKMAQDEKEKHIAQTTANILLRNTFGEQDFPKQNSDEPDSLNDMEIYRNYFYRHWAEVEFEEKFEVVANHNKYSEIEKEIKKSLFYYGVASGTEYLDEHGVIKIKDNDIRQMVVSPCKKRDFSDAEGIGFMRTMSINDLEQETGQLSRAEKEGIYDTLGKSYSHSFDAELADPEYNMDEHKVEVLDFYFKSTNEFVFEQKEAHGNMSTRRTKYNRNPKSKKRKVKRTPYKVWYKATWVVDTDYIFNYGLCNDMKRMKNSLGDPLPPVIIYATDIYQGQPRGVLEQMRPFLDAIQLDWMRLQKVKAEAKANGYVIDLDSIENITLGDGGEKLSPKEVLDLATQRNIFVARYTTPDGQTRVNSPVTPIPGGIGPALTELVESLKDNLYQLYDVIGFNEVSAGSNVDPRLGVRLGEQMVQSTNNALYHIVDGSRYITEQVAKAVDVRFNDAAAKGTLHKTYSKALGKNSVYAAKMSADYRLHDLSIKIEDKPDDYQKQQMELRLNEAIKADKITSEAAAIIKNTDNVKKQEMLLGFYEKKREEQKHKREQENIQLNNEGAKNAGIETEQVKFQNSVEMHKLEMEKLATEHQYALEETQEKGQWDLRVTHAANMGKVDVAEVNKEAGIEKTEILADSNEYQADAYGKQAEPSK